MEMTAIHTLAYEGAVLSRLKHPNIVHYIDHGEGTFVDIDQKHVYAIISEFAYKDTLYDYMRSSVDINIPARLRLFKQLVQFALELYNTNVLHGDWKNQHILLSPDRSTFIVSSWSLARAGRDTSPLILQGLRFLSYDRAPEIARNRMILNEATEVFALGTLLFQLSTNCNPWRCASSTDPFYAYIMRSRYNTYWRMVEHCTGPLQQELKSLLTLMLCSNPCERLTLAEVVTHPFLSKN